MSSAGGVAFLIALLGWMAGTVAASEDQEGMLGVLTPRQEVELEPSFEGQLLEVRVRIGDSVSEGMLVARLDPEPIRRNLEEAEARLEQARAEEQAATTRLRVAEEALGRQQTLLEREAVSREVVRAAERSVDLALAELNQARAVVRQHEATARQQHAYLAQTELKAPFAGTVAERYANIGATVGPDRPVARLISNELLWARFAAPVSDAGALRVGGSVRISVVSVERELAGVVRQIGSEVDPASGMIICEAEVSWPEGWRGAPLAGQAVRVRLAEARD